MCRVWGLVWRRVRECEGRSESNGGEEHRDVNGGFN